MDLRTEPDADLDTFRAAFVPTKLIADTGRERPGWPGP